MEFDRVHYPLPLAFQEVPDPDSLQKAITRLRIELEEIKQAVPEDEKDRIITIYQQNEELKQRLKRLEFNQNLNSSLKKESPEIESLILETKSLEEENQRLKLDGNKEARSLRKKNEELQVELDQIRNEMDNIINQLESESEERMETREIKIKLNALALQLDKTQKSETKINEEIIKTQTEIDKLADLDSKQKQRIKDLETELQTAIKNRNAKVTVSSPSRTISNQNRLSRSPQTRSPGTSTRFTNSPKTSTVASRNNSRPGSDRIPTRTTQPYRQRSPGASPASSINRTPPGSRQRTPPNRKEIVATRTSPNTRASPNSRVSSNTRNSPKTGYRNRSSDEENNAIRKRSPGSSGPRVSDIDARLSRLQELLKKAKS